MQGAPENYRIELLILERKTLRQAVHVGFPGDGRRRNATLQLRLGTLQPGEQRAGPGQLAPLDEREREILKLRFGLDRGEPRTLEEVGEHFNLTRERIRQIEARAMSKLRHPSSDTGARDLLAV